ncbi:MAG: hybrid sensor histidine kinase/response regulator transcription factor, partial [Cyclobacteriaceae bacterium]
DFNTLIRRIMVKNDSNVFNGAFVDLVMLKQPESHKFALPFDQRDISFEYTAASHLGNGQSSYSYLLEGYDQSWSKWASETKKEYTSLLEGDYTFKVKAQNVFGVIGEEAMYRFTILPPWYRTWWAYSLFVLAGIGFIGLIVQLRFAQLRREKAALEKQVSERTGEVLNKNQQLQRQAETLAFQAEKLRETDQLKSRLFANISHEFRTPLTLIKGPVDQLAENPDSSLSQPNISMIRRNTNRLLRLVNQLLDLSKLDAGRLQLVPTEGDIFKCLRAATSSFTALATQQNLDYQVSIPSSELLAFFDRDKLEKIIYNLLSNAFKFTPDQGTIIFSASYDHNQMTMTVTDSGRGIPLEKLNYIFDRFYQVDDSQTREQEGTGIGLALTKELIVLMNGSIEVNSDPESGSTFHIIIPMEKVHTSPAPVSSLLAGQEGPSSTFDEEDLKSDRLTDRSLRPGKSNLVLVVEDNVDMRNYIRQQLCEDYEVLEALHGQDGLNQARHQVPDLIITDLMMPRMDGTELCQQLKTDQRTSHIPVIMLTAKASLENKIEGLETGADDYLTKPFDSRELAVRVKNLIDQRQKLRELFAQGINVDPKQITVTSLDEQFLQNTLDLLEEKYADANFGVPQMQESLTMSKTQLHRKVKALTDQAPGELLRNFRLKRAAQILAQEGENVTQVAYSVGFNNLSYFAKCFKDLHGVAPSEYANKLNQS